jgi:hypothetical protein
MKLSIHSGLIWRMGKVLDCSIADRIAQANGLFCAEKLVAKYTGTDLELDANLVIVPGSVRPDGIRRFAYALAADLFTSATKEKVKYLMLTNREASKFNPPQLDDHGSYCETALADRIDAALRKADLRPALLALIDLLW